MTRATLAGPVRFELEVKKSRFLAAAAPAADVAAALAFLDAVSDADATHNCWAYRIGAQYRFADDGEPGGTAGRPILAAIDGQGLDEVIVVVTRWYGGIKLGAGGLVRAYGGAAAECLRAAPRVALVAQAELDVRCAFDDVGALHVLLASHGARKLAEAYDAGGVALRVALPADAESRFRDAVRDATRGRAHVDAADRDPRGA